MVSNLLVLFERFASFSEVLQFLERFARALRKLPARWLLAGRLSTLIFLIIVLLRFHSFCVSPPLPSPHLTLLFFSLPFLALPVLSAALRSSVSLALPCPLPAIFSASLPSSFSSSPPVSPSLRLSVALFLCLSFSLPLCLLSLTSAFPGRSWFLFVSRFVSFSLSLSLAFSFSLLQCLCLSVSPSLCLSVFCLFICCSFGLGHPNPGRKKEKLYGRYRSFLPPLLKILLHRARKNNSGKVSIKSLFGV